MPNNLEFEILTRPADGTAISLVALRLRTALLDGRTGEIHDHRIKNTDGTFDGELPATVAPAGGLAWHTDTALVWNRTEWVERHGPLPVAVELRVPAPQSLGYQRTQDLGGQLSMFVASRLDVPVTFVVVEGTGPWPMRDSTGHHIRMCFPTRALAGTTGHSVLDRSGEPSGFGTRLAMASNTRLSQRFTLDVAQEFDRLQREPSLPHAPKKSAYLPSFDPDPFDIDLPVGDLFELNTPNAAPDTNPVTHPHVARLRREAPRGLGMQDLRDFELAMSFATTLEDALGAVTVIDAATSHLEGQRNRIDAHILDHTFQLDRSRHHRASVRRELESFQSQRGLVAFLKGRMEVASLARARKASEVERANEHVQELKAAIKRLRTQEEELRRDLASSSLTLAGKREELKVAVLGLNKADPRVLLHLLGFLAGAERDSLKAAMAKALPKKPAATEPESGSAEGEAGPPARPTRARGLTR